MSETTEFLGEFFEALSQLIYDDCTVIEGKPTTTLKDDGSEVTVTTDLYVFPVNGEVDRMPLVDCKRIFADEAASEIIGQCLERMRNSDGEEA